MIKIDAIKLPDAFDIYKNTDGEKEEFLEPVSKINIFVGSNNSGKSRFIRHLASSSDFEFKDRNLQRVNNGLSNRISNLVDKFNSYGLVQLGSSGVKEFKNALSLISDTLNTNSDKYEKLRKFFTSWSKVTTSDSSTFVGSISRNNLEIVAAMIRDFSLESLELLSEIPIIAKIDNPNKVYIPTLRGLRPLVNGNIDVYAERTQKDYFTPKKDSVQNKQEAISITPEIFTGLKLYDQIHSLKNGEFSERHSILKYEKFISEHLYENKPVELIAKPKYQIVFVKIGKEKEQPIYELGDGIQSSIILTFLPFIMQEQTFFFIEEPEMFLHPGLQRKILNFYNSLEQHTFFLTTHSNHFLDITIDIKDASIFTFRKIFDESDEDELTPNFTIEAVDSGCESSLELLGVRNSSVFLVNATIWVEGITDRLYLRKMLNSYMDYLEENDELKIRLEEDTHYSFVEYGGANITHWSFLDSDKPQIEVERLCAKAFVIIDMDGEGKKETRKDALKEKLKERLVVLPCREVENLLPYSVIKQVVEEYENNNELILKDYDYSKYKDVYLGKYRRYDAQEKPVTQRWLQSGIGNYQRQSKILRKGFRQNPIR